MTSAPRRSSAYNRRQDPALHYYALTYITVFLSPNGAQAMKHMTVMVSRDKPTLPAVVIAQGEQTVAQILIDQGAQKIVDITFLSASRLGQMTEAEWNAGLDGLGTSEEETSEAELVADALDLPDSPFS